jgi:hypothetical protein
MKGVRGIYFPGGLGVSNHTEGSNNSEVGFGGIGSMLGKVWHSEGGGRTKEVAKVEKSEKGVHKGM